MRIVFMGTPDFAVPSLKALLESGETVEAFLLNLINPKVGDIDFSHLRLKLRQEKEKIPVFQPTTLRAEEVFDN